MLRFLHAGSEAASVHVWQGPVLRSIQRFGRLGKRSGNVPPEARHSKDKIKEAKYMYLSIDEAGTHVNVRRFRCNILFHASHRSGKLCQR